MSSLEYYPPFSPKYSHNQYIKFENLQIVSPSEDVKISNVIGHYLRKYGILFVLQTEKDSKLRKKTLQVSWFELFLSVINRAIWSAKTICKHSCNNFQVNTTNSIPQGTYI